LRWNAATDASAGVLYEISVDGGASVYAGAGGLTAPEAVLKNLTASTAYQVVLRARDTLGNPPGPWSAPLTVTTPSAPPTASTGSTWRDLNGDGLADEIIPNEVTPTSSTRFNYFALPEQDRTLTFSEWVLDFIYVAGYSYSLPGGDFYTTNSPTDGYLVGLDSFMPIWSEEIQTVTLAQVMPVFQFVAEPGYAYSVNRELTRSDGTKLYPRIFLPTLWEALGSVATVHEWSPGGPWLEQSYDAFPHVLVRYGKPIGSVSLAGQFAAVTVGTARGLGGILSVPFPATGNIVISLKDLANQVLKAGPKVVWEVWDRINQIRVGTSTVGDLLDLGINTSGEFQVGLKLDDSTQVWFNVSVQLPPAPKLAVDANRDGTITFDATDATSATAPYRFWLNDDDDTGFGPSFPWANSDPEYYPPRRADSSDQVINSQRDGEDLTRIWVNAAGMIDTVKNLSSDLYLGLKWKNTTGHPSIRLFRSADPDGGLGHIKNALVAFGATAGASGDTTAPKCGLGDADAQKRRQGYVDESFDPLWTDFPWVGITAVEPIVRAADFIFRKDALPEIFGNRPTGYLLFEGVQEGKGELMLVIVRKKSDGTWEKVSDGGSVWLQLDNIRRMYVRAHSLPLDADWPLTWRVGSPPPAPYEESTEPNREKALNIPDVRLWYGAGDSQESTSQFPFVPSPGEQKKCVVFVHGIDLNVPTQQGYAQSFFKRLWWQGYQGRFVAFRWSTVLSDDGPFGGVIGPLQPGQEWFSIYNSGEYRSWKGGSSLRKFVDALRNTASPFYFGSNPTIGLLAHSLGNACASEALRQGMQVDSYVALKAAIPLSCYYPVGTPAPANDRLVAADAEHPTPQHAGFYNGYHGFLNSIGSANKVNYFEPRDFWLATGTTSWGKSVDWVTNEAVYKPDNPMATVPRSGVLRYFWNTGTLRGYFRDDTFYRFVAEPHESMAHVSRPRTSALGAGPRPPNFTSELNMATYDIGLPRRDHSPLFQRDIQLMYGNANGTPWGEPLYDRLIRDLGVD
jgi:hypothetical protein